MSLQLLNVIKEKSKIFIRPQARSNFEIYLIPFFMVSLVVIAKLFLRTFVSEQTSYHLLTLIIILSAFYGGFRSGIFATMLSAVSENIFFLPKNESILGIYNILSTIMLILGGVYISILSDLRHKADRQKDGFIGLASKELRNPIKTAYAYTQKLLKEGKRLNSEQHHKLTQIAKQLRHTNMTIDELLDITKIQAGKLYFHFTSFDIVELLNETIATQQDLCETHKIIYEGPKKLKITGDKMKIEQVITDLILNAISFSPTRDTIHVKLTQSEEKLKIEVQDFGYGISKENLSHVFDPYFHDGKKEFDIPAGSGLGLYISSVIIKRHGGNISVSSEKGKGSIFTISLPFQ